MRHPAFLIVLLLALFVLGTAETLAQRPRRLSPEERAAELKKELGLNDEQSSKVKAIYEEQDKEMRKLFESADGDRAAMREMMQQKVREMDDKIMALLSEKQKEKYRQYIEKRRARMEQRRPPLDR